MRKLVLIMVCVLSSMLMIAPVMGQGDAAYIRVAHFMPFAPAVDLYVDGVITAARSTLYLETSDWIAIAPGSHAVNLTTAGGDFQDALFEPRTVDLGAGTWTTVFAAGPLVRNNDVYSIVTEDYDNIPAGSARVTIFHGIDGAVPINFYAGGAVQVNTLAYPFNAGNNDGAATLDLPAGNYSDIQILRSDNGQLLLELGDIALEDGKYYLIAATGLPELAIAFDVEVTDPAAVVAALAEVAEVTVPDVAFLRMGNFFKGGLSLDVFVDGELSDISGMASGSASDWISVTPGTHDIAVGRTGENIATAIFTETVDIPAGNFATVLVTNAGDVTVANINVLVENYSDIPADRARVTVINGVKDLISMNVYLGEDTLLLQELSFPGAAGDNDGAATVDIDAGTYDIRVTPSTTPSTSTDVSVVDLDGTALEGGMYYLLAVTDAAGSTGALVIPTDVSALLTAPGG